MSLKSPLAKVNKTNQRGLHREAVVHDRHDGNLFDLSSIALPAGGLHAFCCEQPINLILMVSGGVLVSAKTAAFTLAQGHIWMPTRGDDFSLNNLGSKDAVLMHVVIKAEMLQRFRKRNPKAHSQDAKRSSNARKLKEPLLFPGCELTRLALQSFRLYTRSDNDELTALKLEELLLLKLRDHRGHGLHEAIASSDNPRHEKLRQFMEEHVTQQWSVAEFAKHYGMSLTAFKTHFKQVFSGKTPKVWINERRLFLADLALRSTNLRLIDVAIEHGFSSQSYFTQLYKAHFGIAPSEARS